MSWNYRVVQTRERDGSTSTRIAKVFYYANSDPYWWCEAGDVSHRSWWNQGPARESLLTQLRQLSEAINRPWLEVIDARLREVKK